MIKKILLSLWLFWLWIINFSNARCINYSSVSPDNYSLYNLNDEVIINDFNGSSLFTFLNKWNFYLDSSENSWNFYYSNLFNNSYYHKSLMFWTNSWLYIWLNYNSSNVDSFKNLDTWQWFITDYCFASNVDFIDSDTNYFKRCEFRNSSCSVPSTWDNVIEISNDDLLNWEYWWISIDLSNPDKFFVNRQSNDTLKFCFIYSDTNSILCSTFFAWWSTSPTIYWNSYYRLLNDLDLNNIWNNTTYSPRWSPSNWWWTEQNKQNYICPTFWQLLKQQNFNTWLCYNTTLRFENWQLTTIPQKNIQEAFTDYEEFTNYRSIYKNKCDTIQGITEECENAFTGEIEKYIIIANAEETWINKKTLRNNCNIALNLDLNRSTCTTSWYIVERPTEDELIERIANGNYTTINDIYVPGTWNILNRLLEDWETREEKANRDILWNFTQLVWKITSIFNARSGVQGIIPEYILWLIFVSLFLTVILKK